MNQITRDVLLVRPRQFGPNSETALTNAFQVAPFAVGPVPAECAVREFDGMVDRLTAAGVRPLVLDDTDIPARPDAVFPNNWVSFHEDGSVILYPMAAASRRPERRPDLIRQVGERGGFRVCRLVDLSYLEQHGVYLEGTGSLVIDRRNGVAYAALSQRTHPQSFAEFTRATGIEVISFHTGDEQGLPVYHTNVMLSIGHGFVVICAEVIRDGGERFRVLEALRGTGRRIIEIGVAQMRSFAGNVLELAAGDGRSVVVMSARAAGAYEPLQVALLREFADIVAVPLPTIEGIGGGSARCMLAEIFLPWAPDTELCRKGVNQRNE